MHTTVAIKRNGKLLNWKRGNRYSLIIQEIYQHNYIARYFQTLSGEKWRSFDNSFCSVLKLRSTELENAWQFNNFA